MLKMDGWGGGGFGRAGWSLIIVKNANFFIVFI